MGSDSDRVDRLGSEAREYLNETCKDPRSLNPDRIIDQLRTALAAATERAERAEADFDAVHEELRDALTERDTARRELEALRQRVRDLELKWGTAAEGEGEPLFSTYVKFEADLRAALRGGGEP